jgi:hypothetical protein
MNKLVSFAEKYKMGPAEAVFLPAFVDMLMAISSESKEFVINRMLEDDSVGSAIVQTINNAIANGLTEENFVVLSSEAAMEYSTVH